VIPVLTAEDVRAQDAAAGTSVEQLMRNAGWAVARAARRAMGGTYGRRVVVLCGKGNNGGDGLVAARALAQQGASVAVALVLGEPRGLALEALRAYGGGRIVALDALPRELARADLVIDAIFGVGLARAPEGGAARAISLANDSARPILAADVPSGIDADTGAVLGEAVRAARTVTFTGWKPGLLFAPGRAFAGEVEIADIGVPRGGDATARALEASDVAAKLVRREFASHKRNVGTVLVVAGSRAMPGAAALVVAACVHAGAGLTTLCAPESVCDIVLARVPEITTIPVPESSEGTIDPKALDLIRPRLGEFHSIVVGPGLTTHPAAVETVRALVAEATQPVVLDADAITAFAGARDLLAKRRAPTVLTPHAGELARLLERTAPELEAGRLAAATDAARELNATVVLKGPGTVVAGPPPKPGPSGHVGTLRADARAPVFVNTTGGAALAQGGTGDVLAGIVAAFVAPAGVEQAKFGLRDVQLAAEVAAAVWVHGRAADRIAARVWPHPANASALVDELGPVLHEVSA
jgi:NAD(P)H-hydrate epimerase